MRFESFRILAEAIKTGSVLARRWRLELCIPNRIAHGEAISQAQCQRTGPCAMRCEIDFHGSKTSRN